MTKNIISIKYVPRYLKKEKKKKGITKNIITTKSVVK